MVAVVLWATLVALAESAPLSLRRQETSLRLTAAFEFGALLCFGIVPGATVVVLGRLVSALLRRTAPLEAIHGAAHAALMIGVSGAIYFEQGGAQGLALAHDPVQFKPIVLAMVAFALTGAALEVWRSAAESPRGSRRTGSVAFSRPMAAIAIALPMGLAFAWLEATSGPTAAACALALLVMGRGNEREPESAEASPVGVSSTSSVETVRLLTSAIDAFDPFTRGLSARIANAAVRVARQLGLEGEALEEIAYGALLHDIGRTAIRLDFLARPGKLEAHERAVLQTHPTVGYEILRTLPDLRGAAEIVYAHHEQPDGRGYPRGLKADDIPIGSRIIMVAAAFDAMTRERPYRRGLNAPSAYEELRRNAGTQFFPDVVEAFIQLHITGELDREPEGLSWAPLSAPREGDPLARAA